MSTIFGPLVVLMLIVEILVFIEMYEVAWIFIAGFGVVYALFFVSWVWECRRRRVAQLMIRLDEVIRR